MTEMVSALAKTFAITREGVDDQRLARDIVYNAGRLAWRLREGKQARGGLVTEYKTSVSDVVTEADRAAEQFVAEVLELLRPDDGVVGEEGASRPSKSGHVWVIDPVDGTYNFTRGSDYWCSAIALVEGKDGSPEAVAEDPDRLVLGAVHRPAMGYTWIGGPSITTTLDDKPLPRLDATTHSADHECLGTYLHPTFMKQPEIRSAWMAVVEEFASVRMLGSGSVDLASVAHGELGAWIQHSVKSWDWLPGKALVEGVGGTARRVDARGVTWSIAGPENVVDTIEQVLRAGGANSSTPSSTSTPLPWASSAYSDDVDRALRLAGAADAITMKRFLSSELQVSAKPDMTPVSDADLDTERTLRGLLSTECPDDEVLGEEFGGEPVLSGRQWVIDPIDGTKNYVRGVPVWATLISLMVDGYPQVGVVSAPVLSRRWIGITGEAAWVLGNGTASSGTVSNGTLRKLYVSTVSNVGDSSISMSSLEGWKDRGLRDAFVSLTDDAWRLRGFGDFYSYCLVAEGAVDIAAEPDVSLWDLAALVPVVEGAGGTFTSLAGARGPHGGDALATNGLLHETVRRRLTDED